MANGPTRVARGLARDAKKSGVKDYAGPRTGRGPAESKATRAAVNRATPQTSYSTGPRAKLDSPGRVDHRGTTGNANRGAELNRRVAQSTGSPEAGRAAEMKRARGATKAAMRSVRAGAAADAAAAAAKTAARRAVAGTVARAAGAAGAAYTAGEALKGAYDNLQKNPPKRDLRSERTVPARPKR